jgi:hypothetical protein
MQTIWITYLRQKILDYSRGDIFIEIDHFSLYTIALLWMFMYEPDHVRIYICSLRVIAYVNGLV